MKVKLFVLLFGLTLIFTGCGNNKSNVSTQVADTLIKAPVTDYEMMIVARLFLKPEKIKEFTEAAKEIIEKSNKEPGCKFYQLYQDPYENTKFVFVEEYKNQAAIDAHFAADYFKAFGPKIADLVAAPAVVEVISKAKEVVQ